MGVEAKVIADSISESGHRITTIQVKMHRFVLSEQNTHRSMSRNSASSRAIPTAKYRQMCIDDPALPIKWGSNKPGMQAGEELASDKLFEARAEWLRLRDLAVQAHIELERLGLHKQVANRILEPFMWHTAVITATDWDNFFNQRIDNAAQPEMYAAALAMGKARHASVPVLVSNGSWHLPYVSAEERRLFVPAEGFGLGWLGDFSLAVQISSARCARTSYLTQEGIRDFAEDLRLYGRLTAPGAGHWSPLEHVATPCEGRHANFNGWQSLRAQVEPEVQKFDVARLAGS